jgi:hypothetical protein
MKTAAWFILTFLLVVPLVAQDGATCAVYNPPINVIGTPVETADNGHITGYHYFSSQATASCNYTDPSTNYDLYCASTATVDMAISGGDTGITTSSYHVNHTAKNIAGGGNPDGASSATGQSAIAWETCILANCAFNVTVGPITFPPSAIWSGQQTWNQACQQEPNPNYTQPPGGTCPPDFQKGSVGITPDCSPIIVDTTGHGFQLTSANNGVLFDILWRRAPS